ncbi:hypothetical protein NKR19_g3206 [Coniochaeta hoffmannii]|uniref:Uncharacterized protein n=1 Tax=Coniochaeta hoffmannii TaxID=91930 RepID=A0AA38VYJ0_9PEZI|nr:hypothetical protein NKR19_g3206 [Coniochaeta hoffmannii]
MYGYGRADASEYMRESRGQRARASAGTSGEYYSSSYTDHDPYTRGAAPSSTYDAYDSGHGSSAGCRSGSEYAPSGGYYAPPSPGGRSGHSRSSFDDPAYDYDGYSSDGDHLRGRFGKSHNPSKYTRRSPSPPPMPRSAAGYGTEDDLRSDASSSTGPRWVAAMSIKEADENDPRLKRKAKAPYVYAGTTDPDGTVVDKPKAHRGEGRHGASTEYAGEYHRHEGGSSGSYPGRSAGGSYGRKTGHSGSYARGSPDASYDDAGYPGASYGASYGGASSYGGYFPGPSSFGRSYDGYQ